ncbi:MULTISPECIES: filamentous hemagglutinin N-terminal domain-containing protein [Pseudanabaena]|uniref:Filamentous hemagglutinin family outer membrane protein n=2 Tax=Pseudanabaena TaxID=1152 RepID=L8MZT2_9CYAN|nr:MULTISPECIES: filamentous hemagglutinin N-terminal domain-containing protein [Pseudanabaena]ELS31508.1 filamentous hemagglutinin family outer membrane protein [Pseudanabaena biceps PCC 7429]MDG3496237.1 filamentous hemagglutinin N-terminal domain-containing protein [Pseudanabaena catenata USMAC16]
MSFRQRLWWCGSSFLFLGMLLPTNVSAQSVTADGTLSTTVTSPDNLNFTITNGNQPNGGGNLFHSFSQFSVPTGGSATFNLVNTPNIKTIFSRVTGGSVSNIDGLIQTTNNSNPVSLFLLNPNGIIFGANASLNIGGSFVGTTANSVKFIDGTEFSAVNVNNPPLLTISSPLGLEMGANAAPITVQSNLTTGLDLILEGGRLDLQGQLIAGRDITLKAQDTVKIRDTVITPFLAQAGRNLTIQGNQNVDILALKNSGGALRSGGDLRLVSNGNISGDAHFVSGGNVSFQTVTGNPGKFISLFDPIIYANGDVVFGDYTGVALKVEATGSIEGGNITITGPDTTVPSSDPDFMTLTTQSAAILRAGVKTLPTANVPKMGVGSTNFTTGTVAGLPSGSIRVASINTSNSTGGDGGSIILNVAGDIVTGDLNSSASGNGVNGGSINILSNGNISINGTVDSSIFVIGNSGHGGDITIATTNGNLSFIGSLYSGAYSNVTTTIANGGAISLSTTNGNLSVNGDLDSSVNSQGTGKGGAISLSTTNGALSVNGGLYSYYSGNGNGGDITLSTINGNLLTQGSMFSVALSNDNTGNGGNIKLSTTNGNLSNQSILLSYSLVDGGNSGNGGNITLSTTNGNLSNQRELYSLAYSEQGNSGNGGNITFSANNGNLSNQGELYSLSLSLGNMNSGNGGNITFSANNGNLSNQRDLYSSSVALGGNSGYGGDINLIASKGNILGNMSSLYTFSVAPNGTSSNGGSIKLEAKNQISGLTLLTTSSSARAGSVSILGHGDLAIADTVVLTSKQVSISIPFFGTVNISTDGTGRSGDVNINSVGNLTLNNSRIDSDTKGLDSAGNVTLTSNGLIRFDNSQITSSTSNAGLAGNINLNASKGIDIGNNSRLSALTSSSGNAGNIGISTGQLTLFNGSEISTSTQGSGNAGNVEISANNVTVQGSIISSQSSGSGNSGSLDLHTSQLALTDNAQLSTASSGLGKAGNITINSQQVTLENSSQITSRSQGTGDGGTIQINARSLFLNDGSQINAQTNFGNGGNLIFSLGELLLLRNESLLSAEAGGKGNGGNITISSPFIIGLGNSDIVANAFQGNGGNIQISTNGIFGLKYRPYLTDDNDITASSQFGLSGTVNISNLNFTPAVGLIELPTDVIDPSQRIAQGCQTLGNSRFVVTGRGGLPDNPSDRRSGDHPWIDIRDPVAFRNSNALATGEQSEKRAANVTPPIVEATGWQLNAKGEVDIYAANNVARETTVTDCAGFLAITSKAF